MEVTLSQTSTPSNRAQRHCEKQRWYTFSKPEGESVEEIQTEIVTESKQQRSAMH